MVGWLSSLKKNQRQRWLPLAQEVTKFQVIWRLGEYSGEISLYTCFIYLLLPVILFILKIGGVWPPKCSFGLCLFFSWTWIGKSGKSTRSSGFFWLQPEAVCFCKFNRKCYDSGSNNRALLLWHVEKSGWINTCVDCVFL